MPAIINNLSVDFTITDSSSIISTKQIDFSKRNSLYAIDDIFDLKYFSSTTDNKKTGLYIATIKVDFESKQNFTLTGHDDLYSFLDTNTVRRAIIVTTNDSDIYGIRYKQSKLLLAIQS